MPQINFSSNLNVVIKIRILHMHLNFKTEVAEYGSLYLAEALHLILSFLSDFFLPNLLILPNSQGEVGRGIMRIKYSWILPSGVMMIK